MSKTFLLLLLSTVLYCSTYCIILTPERSQLEDDGASNVYYTPYKRKDSDPTKPSNPIVLIPGDGGSRLRANLTGKPDTVHYVCSKQTSEFYDLWLNFEQLAPITIDCWADNMKLAFNTTTNRSMNAPGVDVEVTGFGNTDTVEWLDSSKWSPGLYFASIVDALVSWGYTRGKNIAGAPFDWRRSPPELQKYYIQLKTLIEMLYRYNENLSVLVLGHSMGNPVMNYFYHNYVDQAWKDKYIKAHVSLAGAWGGSMQIVKLFASGYNMDYYRILLPPSALRGMQRSFTSSAYLLPSPQLWNEQDVLASTVKKNYTTQNLDEFFDEIQYPIGKNQHALTKEALRLDPPGVKVHCVYGVEVQTAEKFIWAKGYFPDYQPTRILYGDGDGTVNIRSLETCKHWNEANNAGKSSMIYPLSKADHMSILKDQRTIDTLRSILYS